MPEPAFLWRMTGYHETTWTILFATTMIQHIHTADGTLVTAQRLNSVKEARDAALEQLQLREDRDMTLTGLWAIRDADRTNTGSHIRALYVLCQRRESTDLDDLALNVIALMEDRGELLHA